METLKTVGLRLYILRHSYSVVQVGMELMVVFPQGIQIWATVLHRLIFVLGSLDGYSIHPSTRSLGLGHSLNCQWQVELRSAGVDEAGEWQTVLKDKHVLATVIDSSQLGNICTFRCWPATKRELTPAIEFALGC